MSVRRIKPAQVQHFILVFDRKVGRKVDELHFGNDRVRAVAKYEELEERFRDDAQMDIVLIGSDSIDTVRVTHSTYFEGVPAEQYSNVLSIAAG